jgi:hypothetical protein
MTLNEFNALKKGDVVYWASVDPYRNLWRHEITSDRTLKNGTYFFNSKYYDQETKKYAPMDINDVNCIHIFRSAIDAYCELIVRGFA